MSIKDITGQRFGRLVAKKPFYKTERDGFKRIYWECECDCGNYSSVRTHSLISGHTTSCGCYGKEMMSLFFSEQRKSEHQVLSENLRSNNTSGIKGVTWRKDKNKWEAGIRWKGRTYHLLYSPSKSECIAIREQAEDAVREGRFNEWIADYKASKAVNKHDNY